MATSIRELCESRDSEYTNFFDRNESHKLIDFLCKLIHILYCVCILVLCVIMLFYPLHLYVFVLICQFYVVLLSVLGVMRYAAATLRQKRLSLKHHTPFHMLTISGHIDKTE